MKKVAGILLIAAGIAAAIWLDVIVFFVGGINEIITGFNAHPVNGHDVAWGFVKTIVLSGCGTFAAIMILIMPGIYLLTGSGKIRNRRPVTTRPTHWS